MSDIIALLPEGLSNQIAAGEVVQRPASAVKELLENAVDAGATSIQLIIKDGGKTLIQVIDNGKGMGETDARMSFERHATSKIKTTEDLFKITTKGFRGEALAAISAVAQVELKTKTKEMALGTHVAIDGGKFISQEHCQSATGSNFTVKNLFFNVPARRNFLKDDAIELRHIIEEFERVALAHPEISFSLNSNKNDLIIAPASTLLIRILALFGNHLREKLTIIDEETPYLKIRGFIGKPQAAVKKRGIQFFFVNNRFVKSPYLHFAIANAYVDLISRDVNAHYYVFLDLPPNSIDINIHPTKTEIKFEDEKTVFMLLQSAAKRALGKANLSPLLEFNNESTFDLDYSKKPGTIKSPGITINTNYNPFKKTDNSFKQLDNWNTEFENYRSKPLTEEDLEHSNEEQKLFEADEKVLDFDKLKVFQIQNKYLVAESSAGIMVIDQARAHERILYEKNLKAFTTNVSSQQELFPISSEFSFNDFNLLMELKDDFKKLGFDLEAFGKNTVVVHGTPADLNGKNCKEILDAVLEMYKINSGEIKTNQRENLCRSLAITTSIKQGKVLTENEIKDLIRQLFNCEDFMYSPSGKNNIIEFNMEEIDRQFKRR